MIGALQVNPDAVQRCAFEVIKLAKECDATNTGTRFLLAVSEVVQSVCVRACVCVCVCVCVRTGVCVYCITDIVGYYLDFCHSGESNGH